MLDIDKLRHEWRGNKRRPGAPQAAFDLLDELSDARAEIALLTGRLGGVPAAVRLCPRDLDAANRRIAAALAITYDAMRDHPEELINPCPCRWHRLQKILMP